MFGNTEIYLQKLGVGCFCSKMEQEVFVHLGFIIPKYFLLVQVWHIYLSLFAK